MENLKVAFVAILRTTFDVTLAHTLIAEARARLSEAGFALVGAAEPVTTLEEAQAAAEALTDTDADLLVIFQSTFADSSMVLACARAVDLPLLLWAVPEAHTGERLRLNSLCGINLAGHALRRAGYRYAHVYAAPSDPAAIDTVRTQAAAGRVRRLLRQTRIGRVGEHPAGFETCAVDTLGVRERFGIEITQIDLRAGLFDPMRAVPQPATDTARQDLAANVVGLDTMDATATRGTLSAYVALQEMAMTQHIDGFAVRCWPEFFTEMGCAACGAMSLLSDAMIPCSCECDVNGTITQFILQTLSGEPAFGTDIVSVDEVTDALVVWHCGLAPLSMADPLADAGVTIHSNRKLPLLLEFPLKPGRVTIARLSEATGSYRLVIGSGDIVRGEKPFSGTCGLLHFERPVAHILDSILSEGLEHHLSLTYGDHRPALLALAHMLDLPVLML
jgi:L-fucose isomerase-like protein